ncbi:MAG: hypothetical protein ABSC37_07460 [Xanthobacteraceae bacterium]
MAQQTPLYIIASPRPRVGKTLIARLLIEFFRASDRPVVGYDLNPREPALAGHFPQLVWTVDIADTRGQMALFDQLIADDSITKVIDLGYGPFEQFFAVMGEIDFVQEARRRLIEPIVLFVTDPAPATVRAYAELQHRLARTTLVPVHNESVSVMFDKEDFPPTRAECSFIRIPRLSPIVRGVIDRPSFSISVYMIDQPNGPTEIHEWIGTIFNEFRELELRLIMGRLSSALGGAPAREHESRRTPRP